MFSKIPLQYQRILAFVLPLFTLVVAYFLVVPRYRALRADEAELVRTHDLIEAKQLSIAEAQKLRPETTIAQVAATQDEPVQFLRQITDLAEQLDVRFTNIAAAAAQAPAASEAGGADAAGEQQAQSGLPAGTTPNTLQIKAEGSYRALALFIASLETHPRLISVTDVAMKADKYPNLSAEFKVTRYTGSARIPDPATGNRLAVSDSPR